VDRQFYAAGNALIASAALPGLGHRFLVECRIATPFDHPAARSSIKGRRYECFPKVTHRLSFRP